jgi:hypothetical protein
MFELISLVLAKTEQSSPIYIGGSMCPGRELN